MLYYTINPPEKLASYVRYFWVLEGEASSCAPYIHRSMADGCAELIFHYQGVFDELLDKQKTAKSFSAGLAGQSQQFRRFSIGQNFGIFGVYLFPFAVAQLFKFPNEEAKDQMIDLKVLLGHRVSEIEDKMMLAESNVVRVKVISEFLEQCLARIEKQPLGVFEAIRYIIQTNGSAKVEALAKQNFQSTRQFERNFKRFSGFSPKLFSRIIRFQSALAQYNNKNKSLTQIAYDCGYYDQSHFIQDFKEFSGHSPREYFSGATESTEWRT